MELAAKFVQSLIHIGIILVGAFLILGLPFLCTDAFWAMRNGKNGVDATTSASLVVEQPSGNYVVLINENFHKNKENMAQWVQFFSGGESSLLFEDIACSVAKGDTGGRKLAESFQSRLPEHQMRLQEEDVTLLLSRADHGKFDVIILSQEFADRYAAYSAKQGNVQVIELKDTGVVHQ